MVEYGKEIDDAMDPPEDPKADMEYARRCPRCGMRLIVLERVGATNEDGSPSEDDTLEEFYCRRCRVWWLDEKASKEDFRSYHESDEIVLGFGEWWGWTKADMET